MVDETPLIAGSRHEEKMGHRVLCCCDTRKATILFTGLAAIGDVVNLISSAIPSTYYAVTTWYTITAYSVALFFNLAAVWGAVRFHRLAVSIVLVLQVIFLGLVIAACAIFPWNTTASDGSQGAIITGFTLQIAWQLLVIYSMGSFVSEVSKGIMSKETHAREKYSCCCNV